MSTPVPRLPWPDDRCSFGACWCARVTEDAHNPGCYAWTMHRQNQLHRERNGYATREHAQADAEDWWVEFVARPVVKTWRRWERKGNAGAV